MHMLPSSTVMSLLIFHPLGPLGLKHETREADKPISRRVGQLHVYLLTSYRPPHSVINASS